MKSELRLKTGLPVLIGLFAAAAPAFAQTCSMRGIEPARIAGLQRHGEIALADGRVVRLAGIVPVGEADAGDVPAAADVMIAPAEAPDRWNRLPVWIARQSEGAEPVWLDLQLLSSGRAVIAAGASRLPCPEARRAAEREAREARRGIWAAGNWPVPAADTARLQALAGQFVVVEGRLASLGERPYTTYLNFGRRWTQDMTVTIRKGVWDRMAPELRSSVRQGTLIRVRGMVQMRNGPLIEANDADQIELAEDRPGR